MFQMALEHVQHILEGGLSLTEGFLEERYRHISDELGNVTSAALYSKEAPRSTYPL